MDRKLNIEKINKIPITDQIYDKMISNIKSGTWKVGDKLPSEAELANIFGVNKLTIRLVLQKLNTLGLVETKNGIGTYVIEFNFNNFLGEASDFIMTDDLLQDISEYRLAIEIPCVDLAIERATAEDYDILKNVLNKYLELENNITVESPRENFIELVNLDIAFHKQIVTMSHNTLFLYGFSVCENVIFEHMINLMKNRVKSTEDELITQRFHDEFENLHVKIYKTLKDGDAKSCKKHYEKMIKSNQS